MDRLTAESRSRIMGRIRSSNTKPEIAVRKLAHSLGLRFRLHRRDLPGTPDLVFPRHRLAVFVHGCFWHRHRGCNRASVPSTNAEFWIKKFERNAERDKVAFRSLRDLGWAVLVIWECELKREAIVREKLTDATRIPATEPS